MADKYRVTGKVYSGVEIAGFSIEDSAGVVKHISKKKLIEMIKAGLIENMGLVERDGETIITGAFDKIPSVATVGKLGYKSRVTDDSGHVTGYMLSVEGKEDEIEVSIDKAWELCFSVGVADMKAYLSPSNEKYIIVS
jgi:hypothetical protein